MLKVDKYDLADVLLGVDRPTIATLDDLNVVATELTLAFADDPMFTWLLGEKSEREAASFKLFQALVRDIGYASGAIYRPAAGGAAAIWIPSERLGYSSYYQHLRMLPKTFIAVGIISLWRLMATQRALDRHHPRKESHSYLSFFGVHPALQGRGIGSRLLRACLKLIDDQARAAFLETSTQSTIQFYHRFGFEVTEVYNVRPGAPPIWTMWRPRNGPNS